MMLEKESIALLRKAVEKLEEGFDLPNNVSTYDYAAMEKVLMEVAKRMQNNYPYPHPLFAGQMLKPPHPIARMAYQLAMWINPNNHALDGGKESSQMEKEVVADLAKMFGFEQHLGHLTGGGTMANMEALWVANQVKSGKVLASEHAHYTHQRMCEVLKIPFEKVRGDNYGRMDIRDLELKLQRGGIGTVVVTMGTTGLGMVDPLDEIVELQKKYGFRIHADAAYGGYFRLVGNLSEHTRVKYQHLKEVDSIVIDPHKHGLQPYGCGCVVFRDPTVAKYYLHDSPYTYFTSNELHLGEISLECSRAGASAVGLWATHQLLPPVEGGQFASDLEKCHDAARQLANKIEASDRFVLVGQPELDIVVWAVKGHSTSEMSEKADRLFAEAEQRGLYLSKYKVSAKRFEDVQPNSEYVTCLRSCLMKPEHKEWVEEIWRLLNFK
jgi:glutamate/tyrosine decarboxylase-like PLP-dependent enzyme